MSKRSRGAPRVGMSKAIRHFSKPKNRGKTKPNRNQQKAQFNFYLDGDVISYGDHHES